MSIQTSSATISLGADGILRAAIRPNVTHTVNAARENLAAYRALSPRVRRPLLVDMRDLSAVVDREARLEYAGNELTQAITAVALIVGSGPSRVIGHFFTAVTRPAIPLRLFSEEPEALAWLSGHLT